MKSLKLTMMAATALLAAAPAFAAITTYSTRASFNTAAGPVSTEDFESCGTATVSLANDQALSAATPAPCGSIVAGATFGPQPGSNNYIAGPGQSANATTALGIDLPSAGKHHISFASPATAFGADFNQNFGGGAQSGNPAQFVIELYDSANVLIDSALFDVASGASTFFGLTSTLSFASVRVGQVRNGFAVLDNVSFNVGNGVPEPASWAMMLAGFALAGSAMRTRRRTVATA